MIAAHISFVASHTLARPMPNKCEMVRVESPVPSRQRRTRSFFRNSETLRVIVTGLRWSTRDSNVVLLILKFVLYSLLFHANNTDLHHADVRSTSTRRRPFLAKQRRKSSFSNSRRSILHRKRRLCFRSNIDNNEKDIPVFLGQTTNVGQSTPDCVLCIKSL